MNADIEHIALATDIALLLVAPATANIIGKFANGIADDFLSSLYLATRAPVLMAPAMNTNMLEHEAVRRNLATLSSRGVRFVDPGAGYLACGWIGKGRLAEPDEIVEAADLLLQPRGSLLGRLVLVTAGPTYEDIDPVRYHRQSIERQDGICGRRRGRTPRRARRAWSPDPRNWRRRPASNSCEFAARSKCMPPFSNTRPTSDIVVMAAAVADYMPERPSSGKIEKSEAPLDLRLVRTPDILAELGRARGGARKPVLVGFAAESGDPVERGRAKLLAQARGLHRRQRHHARRCGLRGRYQRGHDHRP